MSAALIKKESIDFLKTLSKNNNREWFNAHKNKFLEAQTNIIAFADALLHELNMHDKIQTESGKAGVFRIYRDVRFSKDKTPYNTHWSGSFKRATKKLRGGYYFHIKPGNTFVSGGFWGPEPADLKRIRQDIDSNYPEWKKILSDKTFIKTFGELKGEQVSSAPRGYSKDNPAIDLLRYKQFLVVHKFSDEEVLSPKFLTNVNDTFKKMRPYFNFMSEILTTDSNGVSLIH